MHSGGDTDKANLLTAQADAAMTQQAYWIAKAHDEKITF